MATREWEAGDVAGIIGNPIYAIEIHPSFGRPHEFSMAESEWIGANGFAIQEVGRHRWLRQLLVELQLDHHPLEVRERRPVMADPFPAICVCQTLCLPNPPLIKTELWIGANEVGLEEDRDAWLWNLLSILKGAYTVGGSETD
jgi:hypothetical protein